MRRLIDVITDRLPQIVPAYQRRAARALTGTSDIVSDTQVPAHLAIYAPGNRYGRFHERIVRREVRRAGIPAWFHPREDPAHVGLIFQNGTRVYLEVEIDPIERSQPSTFDREIRALAQIAPQQHGLFDVFA